MVNQSSIKLWRYLVTKVSMAENIELINIKWNSEPFDLQNSNPVISWNNDDIQSHQTRLGCKRISSSADKNKNNNKSNNNNNNNNSFIIYRNSYLNFELEHRNPIILLVYDNILSNSFASKGSTFQKI